MDMSMDVIGQVGLIIRIWLQLSGLFNLIELSPRKISLVFLVFIPAFIAFTYLFRNQIFSFFQIYWMAGALAIMMIGIVEVVLYLIMLAIYAPYGTTGPKGNIRLVYRDKVFSFAAEQYYQNTVIEYWLVRKIILIAIPLFIILTTLSFADPQIKMPLGILIDIPLFQKVKHSQEIFYQLLSALWAGLFFTASGGLLRILFWVGRKNFRYNFARGCAILSKHRQDSPAKLEYLMLSMNSYNKFLQRTIRVKMNESIQSKIAKATLNNPEKINQIDSYFDFEDNLGPAKELSKLSDLNLANDEFFVKAKVEMLDIVKEWGAVSAVVIPLIVTIVKQILFLGK
jgi:hypothetical protein